MPKLILERFERRGNGAGAVHGPPSKRIGECVEHVPGIHLGSRHGAHIHPDGAQGIRLANVAIALFAIGVMLLAIVLDVPADAGDIQITLDRAATSDHLSLPRQLKDMIELHTADTASTEATGQCEECRELRFLGRTRATEHERGHTVRQRPRSMPGALNHGPQRLGRSQRRTLEERIRIPSACSDTENEQSASSNRFE